MSQMRGFEARESCIFKVGQNGEKTIFKKLTKLDLV